MDVRIIVVAALLGLAALFLWLKHNEQDTAKITELKQGQVESITGMVNSVYVTKAGHTFLKVADTSGEVSVVAFNNSNIDGVQDIEIGDQVSVIGRVEQYKGKLEIIAKEIKKV